MNISNTLKALILCIFGTPLFAGGHSNGHPILTPLEPEAMNGSYTKMLMGENEFKENSGFDEKTYQLIALAASAGMKCEYCIAAHTALAKGAGATDEEIKTVAMMAGIVAINSTILYTNQYDMDELKKMFSK